MYSYLKKSFILFISDLRKYIIIHLFNLLSHPVKTPRPELSQFYGSYESKRQHFKCCNQS